jgi:hypothetical protein
MDDRFYVARKPDGLGWTLYLPLDKLLIELNGALRGMEARGEKAMLPRQDAASLGELLREAGVDADFPTRLPLGGPQERWLDPLYRARIDA